MGKWPNSAQLTRLQADAKKRSAAACWQGIELADIRARSRKRQETARGEVVGPRATVWPGSRTSFSSMQRRPREYWGPTVVSSKDGLSLPPSCSGLREALTAR
jgi:hypothetical protein